MYLTTTPGSAFTLTPRDAPPLNNSVPIAINGQSGSHPIYLSTLGRFGKREAQPGADPTECGTPPPLRCTNDHLVEPATSRFSSHHLPRNIRTYRHLLYTGLIAFSLQGAARPARVANGPEHRTRCYRGCSLRTMNYTGTPQAVAATAFLPDDVDLTPIPHSWYSSLDRRIRKLHNCSSPSVPG